MENEQPKLKVITLLENHTYPSDVRVRPHMEALAATGNFDVTVICPRGSGQTRRETINGVNVIRFRMLPVGRQTINYVVEFVYSTITLTLMTLWIWMGHGLDVLHYSNPPDTLFVAGILPKLMGKVIVYDLRDLAPEIFQSKFEPGNRLIHRLLLWLERLTCRQADHILVVNESCRQIVIERDRAPLERVTIVRQAPDLNRIHLTQPSPELHHRAKTIIAYLGEMAKQDGIEHLLKALYNLDHHFGYRDWFCALVGSTDDLEGLQAMIEYYGLDNRVWFAGYQPIDNWITLLSAADICIEPAPANPLNNIATMNKLMDYMALGKPSVAYDLREHRITAGEAAIYALPNDEMDLASKIMKLVEDQKLREKMGQIGLQRLQDGLSWPFQRQKLLSVYGSILQHSTS